jgi:hypothetical protein
VGYGLFDVPQNRREDEDDARHALRSSGLRCLKVSRVMVSQSTLKTGRGAAWTMHVEMKPKTDGSMRWAPLNSSTPTLSFSLYYAIRIV